MGVLSTKGRAQDILCVITLHPHPHLVICRVIYLPQFASCSGDGYIRIYEAPDVMNLSNWNMVRVSLPHSLSIHLLIPHLSHITSYFIVRLKLFVFLSFLIHHSSKALLSFSPLLHSKVHDFDAGKGAKSVMRMTWNSSPFDPPAIAVAASSADVQARVGSKGEGESM